MIIYDRYEIYDRCNKLDMTDMTYMNMCDRLDTTDMTYMIMYDRYDIYDPI